LSRDEHAGVLLSPLLYEMNGRRDAKRGELGDRFEMISPHMHHGAQCSMNANPGFLLMGISNLFAWLR
jgi:hypothetical protein